MTIKEIIDHNFVFNRQEMYVDLEQVIKEYTIQKCKELLEIVSNLAEVNVLDYNDYEVNKDSILKAVDLNEFIK
jgi:hypothetical protein